MSNKIFLSVLVLIMVAILGVGVYSLKNSKDYNYNQYDVGKVVNPSTQYSMETVSAHNTKDSCYTVIDGNVYDLTGFISEHPGGVDAISKLCGIDGTEKFKNQHGGQEEPENTLSTLKIGTLTLNK